MKTIYVRLADGRDTHRDVESCRIDDLGCLHIVGADKSEVAVYAPGAWIAAYAPPAEDGSTKPWPRMADLVPTPA